MIKKQPLGLAHIFLILNLYLFFIQDKTMASQEFTSQQTDTVQFLSYNRDGTVDNTCGWGAFIDIAFEPNTVNLDIGGGHSDESSELLRKIFKVTNLIIDPFNRSEQHNKAILDYLEKIEMVDTVTSHSVLNVIKESFERAKHITLAYKFLKPGGVAYFKIWPGDGSTLSYENKQTSVFQSNCCREFYLAEIAAIFGTENTQIGEIENLIIAKKSSYL